jgi:hypothetical protein
MRTKTLIRGVVVEAVLGVSHHYAMRHALSISDIHYYVHGVEVTALMDATLRYSAAADILNTLLQEEESNDEKQ